MAAKKRGSRRELRVVREIMNMRFSTAFQVAWLVAASTSCRTAASERAVPVPIGRLGRPIGTFLRIEGVREEQGKVSHGTLRVDRVDGEALAIPVDVVIESVSLPAGERCVVSGYETGRWVGLPPDVQREENIPLQQATWQFVFTFVMTSEQAPPSLVEHARH